MMLPWDEDLDRLVSGRFKYAFQNLYMLVIAVFVFKASFGIDCDIGGIFFHSFINRWMVLIFHSGLIWLVVSDGGIDALDYVSPVEHAQQIEHIRDGCRNVCVLAYCFMCFCRLF